MAASDISTPLGLCAVVRDTQGLPDNRLRILLDNASVQYMASPSKPLPGLIQWTWDTPTADAPLPGQSVCLARRLLPVGGFANAALPNWELKQAAQGIRWRIWSKGDHPIISGTGTLAARWRETLRRRLLHIMLPETTQAALNGQDNEKDVAPPSTELTQGKAIVLALLFGDRRYLKQSTLDNFSTATLAHSLALSGQHLAVAGMIGLLCILSLARMQPSLYLRRPRFACILMASLPAAMLYLWLGNAPISLIRAATMLAALTLLTLLGRPHTLSDVLCLALLGIVLISPLSVLDTGLQLSALCVAAIGLAAPWLWRRTRLSDKSDGRQPGHWLLRTLGRILYTSLLIQIALLPLSLLLFGNMGHWFALNVLWLPVVGTVVLPLAALGLLCAALGLDLAARLVLELSALPCQWLVDGLSWLAHMGWLQNPALLRPHWTALPAFAALLLALAARAGRSSAPSAARRLLLVGILLLCTGPVLRTIDRFSNALCLDVLDVGQSQAIALRLPDHTRLLLDGGGSASPRFDVGRMLTAPAMTRNDAPRLSAVLNSHPDLDHMGGLLHVLRHFQVAHVLDNGHDGQGEKGRQWARMRQLHGARPLRRGDTLLTTTPGLRLEILHPPAGEDDHWQGNNASIVARLVLNGHGLILFTGDAERPVLQRLLKNGDTLQADVLIAPHHGSRTGFLKAFYKAVRPSLVIASCGFGNRYGFPSKALRSWLAAANIPLLYTGRDGEIRVTWGDGPTSSGEDADAYSVQTERKALRH
ncbi:MAG: DNA internalization-related competence protein ComEC/Rec2 [Desulfovibrio sp.]|nr:DNA internalization-related competence protein ComEC/Rec2 [Desulfovibrio sp.]